MLVGVFVCVLRVFSSVCVCGQERLCWLLTCVRIRDGVFANAVWCCLGRNAGFMNARRAATLFQAAFRGRRSRKTRRGILTVTVLRGIKLADRELFGKQDPYVILRLQDGRGE